MRTLKLLLLCAFFSPISLLNAAPQDYIPVNEYNKIHPEQVELSQKFSELVRNKGLRIADGIQKKPVKIAFIYPGKQISDYWRRSILSFKARMNESGVEYEISDFFTKTTVELRVQEKQMRLALKNDPDYLVFTLDARKHKRFIDRLITRGRPKIILQNITTPLRSWEGKQPFLYVGFDHQIGSEVLANYLRIKTGGTGNYAVLYFGKGYVSEMRGDTFVNFMNKNSKLQLVASYYTDGNRSKARNAALEIIRNHKVKFIYSCSTDVSIGAIDAVTETGTEDEILINGWGGGAREIDAILRGKMDVTVMRMNDDNGVAIAEAVKLDIEGRGENVPVIYSGDLALIEKGINKKELDMMKSRAFRYSGAE